MCSVLKEAVVRICRDSTCVEKMWDPVCSDKA